ncbi:MAG: hypothetical protein JSV97_00740 [candidate division WOR-3 bacterium]|nr:MAG: hypothetical protein JSV97_00740 [candidate division WOR-3 bacterium]
MHSQMKNKEKQPMGADKNKSMHGRNGMAQDTFTFEGVPATSPLGFGMTEFKDWMFEKTKKKELDEDKEA